MSSTLFIILGFSIIFVMTTLGALCVYFLKKPSTFVNMLTIGFASGIMLSASIWSLLIPSIEYSEEQYQDLFILPVAVGFLLGGMFMVLLDKITGHFSNLKKDEGKNKAFKLFTAVLDALILDFTDFSADFAVFAAFRAFFTVFPDCNAIRSGAVSCFNLVASIFGGLFLSFRIFAAVCLTPHLPILSPERIIMRAAPLSYAAR